MYMKYSRTQTLETMHIMYKYIQCILIGLCLELVHIVYNMCDSTQPAELLSKYGASLWNSSGMPLTQQ